MEYAYLNSAAAERSLERTDDYINQHRLSSFFARATYNYDRKVYVKAWCSAVTVLPTSVLITNMPASLPYLPDGT